MDSLAERAFDPALGYFAANDEQLLFPSSSSASLPGHLRNFEFMGRILGKAVYSSILVKPQFAVPFLNKLLDRHNVIDDLYGMDPEVYKNLMSLKGLARDGVDIEELSLNFTVTTEVIYYPAIFPVELRRHVTGYSWQVLGQRREVELVAGGRELAVTNGNYREFQYRLANFKLNSETAAQSRAFLRGFRDIIPVRIQFRQCFYNYLV